MTGRRVCHHRHIAFLSVIKDAPLLTKTVKINQSEGVPESGIPNALLIKIPTSIPAPLSPVPLYFSSLSLLRTMHRSTLSERLEQATKSHAPSPYLAKESACSYIILYQKHTRTLVPD